MNDVVVAAASAWTFAKLMRSLSHVCESSAKGSVEKSRAREEYDRDCSDRVRTMLNVYTALSVGWSVLAEIDPKYDGFACTLYTVVP